MLNAQSILKIVCNKVGRHIFRVEYDYRPFYGCYTYTGKRHTRRALLSYRVLQVREYAKHAWSASSDVFDIIRVLSELGYVTDVVYSRDSEFIPSRSYDLFIGHEGYNFQRIVEHLPDSTIKIFFPMSAYWRFQNEEEQRRINALSERRGVHLRAEREIFAGEDAALGLADGIILLGNDAARKTYPNPERIKILEGATFLHKPIVDPMKKNFNIARKHFLFMSGSGNVHKGLDLLLEAFTRMPEYHLYICTKFEEDFVSLYRRELQEVPNIHAVGYTKLYSPKYYYLVRQCGSIIFPSCSEGSPGSVIDAMTQGLIPIVSRGAHIDVDGLGEYIESGIVNEIVDIVNDISMRDVSWYKSQSEKVKTAACQRFDPQVYRNKLKSYISTIVAEKGGAN